MDVSPTDALTDSDSTMTITEKDKLTILWNLYKDECDWQRHNETQRANLTTVFLAVYAALLAFLPKDRPLYREDWLITAFITGLGIVGALAVLKYWERFMYHVRIGEEYRQQLNKLVNNVTSTRKQGKHKHEASFFPILRDGCFKQHWLWLTIHLGVATLGGVLLVSAIRNGVRPT